MAAGKKRKTKWRTHLGLYKYLFILFGLANVSNFFHNFTNNVLENNILDLLIITYVDDILVFSKTSHKLKKHVKIILASPQAISLLLDIYKYKLKVYKIKYQGLIF